jgi:hypothetical protein
VSRAEQRSQTGCGIVQSSDAATNQTDRFDASQTKRGVASTIRRFPMSKVLISLATLVLLALATAVPSSAALVCDEDGCEPAILLPGPVLIVADDDCD